MVHWGSVCCDPPVPKGHQDELWRRCLIEGSMVVGLSKVTKDNVKEWMFRIRFVQRMLHQDLFRIATFRKHKGRPKLVEKDITVAIVKRWAGLWTNASNATREEFVNSVIHRVVQRIEAGVASEIKEGKA